MDCSPSPATIRSSKSPLARLYKRKGADWKSEFRQSINRRIRENRYNLVDKFRKLDVVEKRKLFDQIVYEELKEKYETSIGPQELDEAIEEYQKLKEQLLQQEIDDILRLEDERAQMEIEDYCNSRNNVFCPRCQKAILDFPDASSFTCENCGYKIWFACNVPSPPELLKLFEGIFLDHWNTGCTQQLQVRIVANQMVFECESCGFMRKAF